MDDKLFKYVLSDMCDIDFVINKFDIDLNGILHIGAHKCEEMETYKKYLNTNDVLWVEALPDLYELNKKKDGINIINEVVHKKDGVEKDFYIYNNTKLNSLHTLKDENEKQKGHKVVSTSTFKTKTLKTIYSEHNIEMSKYNFLVLDTQGTELQILKGAGDIVETFDYIFLEVNDKEIYENCDLLDDVDDYLYGFGFEKVYLRLINGYGNALFIRGKND
tara:strand:- start:247 stop:903 length:657 start_codon:yes stop_codon:yes gene_type:complete